MVVFITLCKEDVTKKEVLDRSNESDWAVLLCCFLCNDEQGASMRQQFQYPWKQKQKHFIIREITLGKYSFLGYSCHKICLYIYFVKPPAQWLSKSNGHSKSFVYRTFFILFQSNSILSSVPLRFICLPPSMHYFNTFPLNKPILLSQFP